MPVHERRICLLKQSGVRVSMDAKDSRRDNVFVERLWRSVKYDEVYLYVYNSMNGSQNEPEIVFMALQREKAAPIA